MHWNAILQNTMIGSMQSEKKNTDTGKINTTLLDDNNITYKAEKERPLCSPNVLLCKTPFLTSAQKYGSFCLS